MVDIHTILTVDEVLAELTASWRRGEEGQTGLPGDPEPFHRLVQALVHGCEAGWVERLEIELENGELNLEWQPTERGERAFKRYERWKSLWGS